MKYRAKEIVRRSGVIRYIIQYKMFFFWFNYSSFISRKSRDTYLNYLLNELD